MGRPERPERPEPVGVLIDDYELAAPEVSDFQSKVIGAGLPTLIDLVAEMRSASPRLANTDGDPLVLIEATLATPDPAGALAALSGHPDFEPADGVDDDDGGAGGRVAPAW
ncbi:hypothetical protein [Conexibacter sp. DBS9H8]|uniref:hypothetical protein n=1 Tax=Conexibacter sp. DBS9H8 TaxID=2937801 RepID=UPI00200F1F02|nr:hypothetical protein [Conexibacter sp. DBS9H8]